MKKMSDKIKHWLTMNRILIVSIGLLFLFAWFDVQQLRVFKTIDESWQNNALWTLFSEVHQPAVTFMWIGVLISVGIIWYLVKRDKSEAVSLAVTPIILILFGVQDIIYYLFSGEKMSAVMCWADALPPIKVISDVLGEACPTPLAFWISVILGIIIAYHVYKYFQKQKW